MKESREKKDFFDHLAEKWDQEVPREKTWAALEDLLSPWKETFRGAAILDAGCGTGQLAAWLARIQDRPRLTAALDPSRAMLARLTLQAPSAAPLLARGETLPFRAGVFDFVLAMGLFPHLEAPLDFLLESRRVLRPGGWLLVFHTASRARINQVHREAGPPVDRDLVLPASRVGEMLTAGGFLPGPWRDDESGWLVSGRKEKT